MRKINIIVMSRRQAENYAKKEHNEKSIIISIASKDQDDANVYCSKSNGIRDIIFLHFNDVSNEEDEGSITKNDAKCIKEFVYNHLVEKIDYIIVHCVAGQCRSAGVAAALSLHFNGNDESIYNNANCVPNSLCKRIMLEILDGQTDYETIF